MDSYSAKFNDLVNGIGLTSNPYVYAFLIIFCVAYAAVIAPQLPEGILAFLNQPLMRLVVIFLIAYLANKQNPTLALLVAIGFIITMNTFIGMQDRKLSQLPEVVYKQTVKEGQGIADNVMAPVRYVLG